MEEMIFSSLTKNTNIDSIEDEDRRENQREAFFSHDLDGCFSCLATDFTFCYFLVSYVTIVGEE